MSGWIVGGIALAIFVVCTIVWNRRERRRQRALAVTRLPLTEAEFSARLLGYGVATDLAAFIWEELQPYYFAPLTPHPSDRIYGDMKIDPDDISDIAVRYEKRFGVWLGEVTLACPADPTIGEFAAALARKGR